MVQPLTESQRETLRASPFAALGLDERIVRAFVEEGYEEPTPIQRAVIEPALDERDVLACAQTGTGKTAGFVAPILQNLISEERGREIRALILAPTRELAAQIGERIQVYGAHLRIRHVVIYGGVGQHQQEIALRSGPEILVATPGRLLDLMNQRLVDLSGLRHFVLDEADRMLDMGFIHDVRRVIAALPRDRQTMLFSATIPPSVATLAQGMLFDPVRVSITPAVTTAVGVTQSVLFVSRDRKRAALEELLLRDRSIAQAIVFTRTKHGANRLAEQLSRAGIGALAIHGNKSQGARVRALGSFRDGSTRVLVATDLAARGIDVDGLSHVINYELPNVPESYVHRIGRTGRAGADGIAISFCDEGERDLLADIERFIRRRIPRLEPSAPARATSPVGPR